MIKAVIFDMDGLMIDTEKLSYLVYRDFARSFGKDLTIEEFARDFPGVPVSKATDIYNDKYHLGCKPGDLEAFFPKHHQEHPQTNIEPKKGLYNLLTYLKENNYKTSVATSSHVDRAKDLVGKVNAIEYFDAFTCGNEVQRGKPNPDIFLKACEKLGVHPSEALVLEDSSAGIEAAYRGNIKVICIPDLIYPREEIAKMTTAILPSLDEVIDFLKNFKD